MFLFEDGRIAYTNKQLSLMKGDYIELNAYPTFETMDGKIPVLIGFNKQTKEVLFEYIDEPQEEEVIQMVESSEDCNFYPPEFTQLDRIESTVNASNTALSQTLTEIREEAIDNFTEELVANNII